MATNRRVEGTRYLVGPGHQSLRDVTGSGKYIYSVTSFLMMRMIWLLFFTVYVQLAFIVPYNYRPSTKLQKSNDFTGYSARRGKWLVSVSHMTIPMIPWTSLYSQSPLDIRNGTLLDIKPLNRLATDNWWPPLETCSNLFT